MTIADFIDHYQQLQTQLQSLITALSASPPPETAWQQRGQTLLHYWQQHLASITGDHLAPSVYGMWRSLHTELHRELRLLNMDLMYLQNSRATATQTQKRQQVGDRLHKLHEYCTQILKLVDCPTPEA